jgi:pimeloyl-ACP methyl ester carboxylesterase
MTEPTEAFIDVRGTRTRILRAGDGPPLLYLHGSGDLGAWLPVQGELARAHTVLRPDHPGFGRSDEDGRIDSVHDLAFFYLDLLDGLGLDRVAVVGSSLGGWIAADLATIEPARVTLLVLIGAAGLRVEESEQPDEFVLEPTAAIERTFATEERRRTAGEDFARLEEDPAEMERYLRNRIATAHLAWNPYFHDPKLVHRLHRVSAPTLVVWGRDDGLVPVAHGHRWAELVPGSRLEVVEGSGHLPHVEQPERFLEVVGPFLAGAPVAR